jgi:hypothetical protein
MMRATLVALSLAAALPAFAIYKWVDENGVTQYTETPPPPGRASTKITPSTTGPSGSTGQGNAEDWKQRELDQRKANIERDQATDFANRKAAHDAANRSGRCLEARRQVELLGLARPIYNVNERGEKVYLEDQDRASQLDAWRKQADTYCGTQ